jgi:stress response protein YsnF
VGTTEEVVPLVEERMRVEKRTVETGRVRVSLSTETTEEIMRETLRSRSVEVERVELGHEVTEMPRTRQEGDVIIVPVVEEILVIEKRLVLKEEIHLRLVESETAVEERAVRRVQQATVERQAPQSTSSSGAEDSSANSKGTVK